MTESYITTLAIFEREKLSFGNEIDNPPDSAAADVFHFAGGTIAARRVALPEITGGATVFAELVQYSNGDGMIEPARSSSSFRTARPPSSTRYVRMSPSYP